MSRIVYQTNLYATQRGKNLNLKSDKLLVFIGINFLMGYHRVPSVKDYWSAADDLNVRPVVAAMTRSRFMDILYLHLNVNSLITPLIKDKLFKLRPFIDIMMNVTIKTVYKGYS